MSFGAHMPTSHFYYDNQAAHLANEIYFWLVKLVKRIMSYSEEEFSHFIGFRLYFSMVLQADIDRHTAISITIFFIFKVLFVNCVCLTMHVFNQK